MDSPSFFFCSEFDQDLSNFDVSSVTDMSFAFWITFKFTGKGLEQWNVGELRDASETFLDSFNFSTL